MKTKVMKCANQGEIQISGFVARSAGVWMGVDGMSLVLLTDLQALRLASYLEQAVAWRRKNCTQRKAKK